MLSRRQRLVILRFLAAADDDRFRVAGFQRMGNLGVDVVHGNGARRVKADDLQHPSIQFG